MKGEKWVILNDEIKVQVCVYFQKRTRENKSDILPKLTSVKKMRVHGVSRVKINLSLRGFLCLE